MIQIFPNDQGNFRILIEPRLEKLITNYNKNVNTSSGDQYIILAKVDVDKFGELSSRYNVTVVPTGKVLPSIIISV